MLILKKCLKIFAKLKVFFKDISRETKQKNQLKSRKHIYMIILVKMSSNYEYILSFVWYYEKMIFLLMNSSY